MLPSLGLFKASECPYNKDNNGGGCHRPFCHFKHPRKDDANPSYTATPTLILEGTQKPASSYPRYVPYPVDEESSSSMPSERDDKPPAPPEKKKHRTAEYVPKNVPKPPPEPIIDTDLAKILGSSSDEEEKEEASIIEESKPEEPTDSIELELVQLLGDNDDDDGPPKKNDVLPAKTESNGHSTKEPVDNGHSSKDSERRKTTSERRHSTSHKSKHRSSESSSSRHKHSSTSSSSSSRHRHHRDDDKRSSKSKASSSSSRPKSSSSSSSKRQRSNKDDRDRSRGENKIPRRETNGDDSFDYARPSNLSTDDEGIDDVEEECKRIFDQFQTPPPAPSSTDASTADTQLAERFKDDDDDPAKKYSEMARKRVAHEQPSGSRPPIDRAFQAKPKHMQSALQSVYMRHEAMKKQRQEEEERAQKELEEREAQMNKILANPAATSSRRSLVAPVANILALQNAKKKIEELKMLQNQKTVARSAPRSTCEVANVTKRIAHQVTGSTVAPSAPPVLEPHSSKINFNLRMQYYNMMVKHCQSIYTTPEDAWERAQGEELAVFKKCSSAVIYKSSATLTINKLRKEAISAGNEGVEKNATVSHDVILAGKLGQKSSWSINRKLRDNGTNSDSTILSVGPLAGFTFDSIPSAKAYNLVAECTLNEEQLKENGFPRAGPRSGQAIIEGFYRREQPKPRNEDERYCQRCGKLFNIASYDQPAKDECNFHPKGTGYRRGFADNQHRCCQQPAGTPGCTYGDYHVSNYIDYANLTGFVRTLDRDEAYVCTRRDIFALDCEMVYTTKELELARVTVVDINGEVAYDACVKPDNAVVDYNTQFSGLTEEIISKESRTLRDVQAVLLSMFHSRTILIGHSLDSDLKALKIIHDTVVDTSVLYPHKMGLPKKKALKTLCIDHLKRIIQENEHGHNSAEDAEVCIQLIKCYLKNRIN